MKTFKESKKVINGTLFFFLLHAFNTLQANTAFTGVRQNFTTLDVSCDMGAGLNLFNTLDAVCTYESGLNTEKCWGQPFTTLGMVTDIKDRGFQTLRIPVSWYLHMGDGPNYTIDEEWMDRVEEVANYAFQNDMYVIINIHHDDLKADRAGSWLFPSYAKRDANIAQIEKVWTQIANRFKSYGDYLIFETLNEPRPVGTPFEWNGGNAEHQEVINDYNKAAVDAIRATGGNNAERFIMVPQVAAQLHAAVNNLIIPNNDDKILVSVHHYSPFQFTLQDPGVSTWGTQAEKDALENDIKSLYDKFVSKGRGVVMGEWGAADKNNLQQRINYYDFYAGIMKKYQVAPINWIFGYNRNTGTWSSPEIENAILKHFAGGCNSEAPFVSFNNISNDQKYIPGSNIEVDVVASDGEGTIVKVELFVNDVLVSTQTSEPYLWNDLGQEALLTNMTSGFYRLKVIAEDNDGFTSTEEITIEVVTATPIPGLIEAEDFIQESGVDTESTSDISGGENVGFIQNSDWTEYIVDVSDQGIYDVTFRVASNGSGGTINVMMDGSSIGQAIIPVTGGWQTWQDVNISLTLEEGPQTLRLVFEGGNSFLFNLNWTDFALDQVTNLDDFSHEHTVTVHPNPVSNIVKIDGLENHITWSLFNMNSKKILSGDKSQINVESLSTGVYWLYLSNGQTVKLIKSDR